jgi:predicted nucleic-acid-binding protein
LSSIFWLILVNLLLNFMKRKCEKYSIDGFIKNYPELSKKNIEIYIDSESIEKIVLVLNSRQKKFKRIIYTILAGRYNDDLYGIEDRDNNITAMKFKHGDNERIYCKEYFTEGKKVVMIVVHFKKNEKNGKKEKNIFKSISKYEYEFK